MIAGAGPVGLTASLFLARAGVKTRLIERKLERAHYSRALVVNPRTLQILEPTGVTEKILSLGLRINGVCFWRGNKVATELTFNVLQHKYTFLVGLSQSTTERLLEEALVAAGGAVERGVELTGCRNVVDAVEVDWRRQGDRSTQGETVPWLLGGDGAHSTVRGTQDIAFEGSTFDREWSLVDVPLDTDLPEDFAHIFFLPGGRFLFVARVIDDAEKNASAAPLWRVMGNLRDPAEQLPRGKPTASPVWASRFRIEHRIAERLVDGHIYLGGDAAHVHSPVGARGMNLGIEDAFVFSQMSRTGQINRYGKVRCRVDRRVMKRIELLTRMARGESLVSRLFRSRVLPPLSHVGAIRRQMLNTVSGLDHPLAI